MRNTKREVLEHGKKEDRLKPTTIATFVIKDPDDPKKSFVIGSSTVRELRFCDLKISLDGYKAKAVDEVTGKVLDEFDVLALLVALRQFLPIVETHYAEMRDQERRSFLATKRLMDDGKDVTVHPEALERATAEFDIDLSAPPKNDDRSKGGGNISDAPASASLAGDATVRGGDPPHKDELTEENLSE